MEISSSSLYNKFNDYITTYNFKCVVSLTKFVMDIKKIEVTEMKKTKTTRNILFHKDKVKVYLKNKYNIDFIEIDDDSDDEDDENPLDKL